MTKLISLLTERYVNLHTKSDMLKYSSEIWNILQKSYSSIGGYLAAGSKEEMIDDCSMIKLVRKNNKIVACRLYKDKFGKKSIGGGTDGSMEGKLAFLKLIEEDIKMRRQWSEVSGALEHILNKKGAMPIPNIYAAKLTGKDIISLNPDGYHYVRLIGGEQHQKIIFGHPQNFKPQ